jgi:hypothetical protein
MNIDPNSLCIEIYKIDKYVEGMWHVLTADDFIGDGVYNFEWFKVKITQRKMEIET